MNTDTRYAEQLQQKIDAVLPRFRELGAPEPQLFESPPQHYRMRAEFRIWHQDGRAHFAMHDPQTRQPVIIDTYPPGSVEIQRLMQPLLDAINASEVLRRRLFTAEFLTATTGEAVVTLIYHRPLDDDWEVAARELAAVLDCQLIGRSRKQRRVLDRDFVNEQFTVAGRSWRYRQPENSFSQPNAAVNRQMLEWTVAQPADPRRDLLELYCGSGNFTLPLSTRYRHVLATEVSKTGIAALEWNRMDNGVDNLDVARLSAEELTRALNRERPFRRLAHVDLDQLDVATLFVDPPRAGLDPATLRLASKFDRILYVSCNPLSLMDNISDLASTHEIAALAFFDQFPYTPHLECGVRLERIATA